MIVVVVLANANNWKKRMIENTTDILCCVCLYAYHLFIHPLTLRYCIKLWPVEETVDSGAVAGKNGWLGTWLNLNAPTKSKFYTIMISISGYHVLRSVSPYHPPALSWTLRLRRLLYWWILCGDSQNNLLEWLLMRASFVPWYQAVSERHAACRLCYWRLPSMILSTYICISNTFICLHRHSQR